MKQNYYPPEYIRRARERLGMTQTELAQALHMSRAAVAKMEAGDRRITERTAGQIQDLLEKL